MKIQLKSIKNFILLIITMLHISCYDNSTKKNEHPNSIVSVDYYQCDYSKNHYDTILSSGTKDTLTEIWGIEHGKMKKSKQVDIDSIDFNRIIQIGKSHLIKRFRSSDLQFSNFEIKKINEDRLGILSNLYVELTFLNYRSGFSEILPLFLDGTIILSNNEDRQN